MIALDTSAIVAIALGEAEGDAFSRRIAAEEAVVGAPTILETRLALMARIDKADAFLDRFIELRGIHAVAFSLEMYRIAADAFDRYGKGLGHIAQLNLGDCMAYAVAKAHDVPLLYKGGNFARTDIRAALP